MPERTLNEALSGSEIKEIILQEIGKRLDGDTTLENDLAYAGFTAQFTVNVAFTRSLTKPTLVWGSATQQPEAPLPDGQIEFKKIGIVDTHSSAESPDVERQSHDLAIPVLMQTPAGLERTKVKIGRPFGRAKAKE